MKSRLLIVLSIALVFVCVLVSCATDPIKTVDFDSWDIHTEAQAGYLNDEDYTKPTAYGAKGKAELSKPVSPTFTWKYSSDVKGSVAESYLVISEEADLNNGIIYDVPAGHTSFTVFDGGMNLKVNTTYYWQVHVTLTDGTVLESGIESFTTEGGIRNLSIEGVTNCRDLGGKTTLDGYTVKQGMLYRTGRYNENYKTTLRITQLGLEQMDALGIVTEIDLRGNKDKVDGKNVYANGYAVDGSEEMVSALGEDVNYVLIPRIWNNLLMSQNDGATMIAEVFEVLCDESNYPIVFHCSIGTDRTGVVAYLIGCALGLSDEDLLRDYLFSNFGDIGNSRLMGNFDLAIAGIAKCEGTTYQEKGLSYLLSIGITQEQIDTIKSIMLEK